MADLLTEGHRPLFSSIRMEQEKKESELLSFTDKYRLVRGDDLVFYICMSMEEFHSMKLELSIIERIIERIATDM